MALSSMTGFARAEGSFNGLSWAWELRSVNGRNLDVRCRLPGGMEGLDQKVRARLAGRLKRGNLQVGLQWAREAGATELRLNERALAQVIAALDAARVRMPHAEPARLDGLLSIRGVLEPAEPEESAEEREAREAALLASFDEALEALVAARQDEGAKL
ncbi:MAG: YicC/YloC family endoribonuclease, partial [Alphaproteobacteria bacterium]